MNWLFIFVPISIVLQRIPDISPVVVFLVASIAIIPIASTLVHATEQLAHYTGQAIGGLLNATFGNAPELIISIVALRAGYLDMVRASLIGAIVANLLLAQGLSFFLGGLRHHDQQYNPNTTRLYSSMMMVSVLSLAIPSTFAQASGTAANVGTLNVVVSILLLVTYGLYLFFMLKTHPKFFVSESKNEESEHDEPRWSVIKASSFLVGSSVLAAFVSEILVGAAEGTGHALGMSQVFMGVICLAVVGGAAEIASAIAMGRKNFMDLSIGISLGSSIQIALFVAPALVLLSYVIAPVPMNLTFHPQALGFLLMVVLIGGMVSGDGKANWYKGAQLVLAYIMLATMLYLTPSANF